MYLNESRDSDVNAHIGVPGTGRLLCTLVQSDIIGHIHAKILTSALATCQYGVGAETY
jgi:hypothetical protein